MDNYLKVITMLEKSINKIKGDIENEEAKLTAKCQEINSLSSQKMMFDTNLTARKYYYEVITDYKNVTKEKRWWYILTFIGRSLVIALLAWISSIIFSNSLVIGAIIAIFEAVVIAFTSMEYLGEVAEERRIKKQNIKEDLIVYIDELKQNILSVDKKLKKAQEEEKNLRTNITNLNSELYLLNAKLDGVKSRRSNAIAQLLHENELEINASFAKDDELLKLERVLNNG